MESVAVPDLHLMIRNGGDAQVCGCADLLMEKCFGGCAALILDWKGDRYCVGIWRG